MPEAPLGASGWARAPRMPLGDAYGGHCRACAGEPVRPAETQLRELCNFGYARGRCDRFPAASGADAVRFSITSDDGSRVRMVYVVESEHAPLEHGSLEYLIEERRLEGAGPGLLSAQAAAFVASYLLRTRSPMVKAASAMESPIISATPAQATKL